MADIFISYSHTDSDYAHDLAAKLAGRGFTVFVDNQIDYGDRWSRVLQEELDHCTAFLVVMTPRAYESEWVQNELSRAKKKEKAIFPLLLEGEEWLSVQSKQYVNVKNGKLPPKKFFKQLNKTVPERGHITPRQTPGAGAPDLFASSTLGRQPGGVGSVGTSSWLKDYEKRLEQEEKRKQKVRENSPPFYRTFAWWISAALNLAACIGIAFLIVPLVEWALNWVLGWLSLSAEASHVSLAILAVSLSGLLWAIVYSAVAVMLYSDDPEPGGEVFFLRGLLGGWYLWLEELEDGPGRSGSFPLNMLVIWALARLAAWASFAFLGFNPDTAAYVVLGLLTVLGAAWYFIISIEDSI